MPVSMGEPEVFEEIYRSYFAPLCYFAQKYIEEEDAEDVINNLFLKLWRQKETFENIAHVQASLYVSTRNSCLDFLKVTKRAEDRHTLVADSSATAKSFMEDIIRTEVWAEIYREINKLPLQCSRVISLSFLEGLKNEEIARQLDISLQTVKNQKSMGLKVLKQKLSREGFILLLLIIYRSF